MPVRVLVVMEASTVTGPVKNLFQFIEWVRKKGEPQVEFQVATYVRGANSNAFTEAGHARGIPITVIPEQKRFDTGVIDGLRRLVADFSPDILQTHNVKSNFLVRVSGLWKSQPWLAFHHGYTATNKKDQLFTVLNRWSMRRASHAVTVCEPFRRHIIGIGLPPERVTVLHNTVQPFTPLTAEERRAVRARLGIGAFERMLVTVGRLSFEKGHRDLVESFAKVASRDPRVHLVIVGDGPERSRVESEAARLGVTSKVHLTGHQSEVAAYYGAADIFVLPSHSEGSPNALLEGMAAGLPCVATSVGGVPEIAADQQTGLIVAPRDADAFAKAVERLLMDETLAARLGYAGQEHVLRKHTLPTYADELLGIYAKLLKR
jgi:glycosyltransferase involved in cell wall biosynthesis